MKKVKNTSVDLFKKFLSKARHEGGEYLIESKGKVLVAPDPRTLFELYKKQEYEN